MTAFPPTRQQQQQTNASNETNSLCISLLLALKIMFPQRNRNKRQSAGDSRPPPRNPRARPSNSNVALASGIDGGASSRTPSSLPIAMEPPPFAPYGRFPSVLTPIFQPAGAAPYFPTFRSPPSDLVQQYGLPQVHRPLSSAPAPFSLPAVGESPCFDPGLDDADMVAVLESAERVINMPPAHDVGMPRGVTRKDPPPNKLPRGPQMRCSRLVFSDEGSDSDSDSDSGGDDDNVHARRKKSKTTTASSSSAPPGIVCNDGDPYVDFFNFRVLPYVVICRACNDKVVGSSEAQMRQHLNLEDHVFDLDDVLEKHGSLKKTNNVLQTTQNRLGSVPFVPKGEERSRLKCLFCSGLYSKKSNFTRHVATSKGKCDGSVPIKTLCVKTKVGIIVEKPNAPVPRNLMKLQPTRQVTPVVGAPWAPRSMPGMVGAGAPHTQQFPTPQVYFPTPPTCVLTPQRVSQPPSARVPRIAPSPLGLSKSRYPGIVTRNEETDTQLTKRVLTPCLPEHEEIGTYISAMHPLVLSACNGTEPEVLFEKRVKAITLFRTNPVDPVNEPMLASFHELTKKWVFQAARDETGMSPAHVRAKIMDFSSTDNNNDGPRNTTFHFRRNENLLLPVVCQLACFVLRRPSAIRDSFVEIYQKNGSCFNPADVPTLLTHLMLQESPHPLEHALMQTFCLSLSFVVLKNGTLKMRPCGKVASDIAATLFTGRAAGLSYLHAKYGDGHHEYSMEHAKRICGSESVSFMASAISKYRSMDQRKPTKRYCTVDLQSGSTHVDKFHFAYEKWSKLIPMLEDECKKAISNIIVGEDWQQLVNVSIPLTLQKMDANEVVYKSASWSTGDIKCKPPTQDVLLSHDRLVASLVLAFHACGGGGMRHAEIGKTTINDICWHAGTTCYSSESIKQFSHREIYRDPTARKLPPTLARCLILCRDISNWHGRVGEEVVIARDGATIRSKEVFKHVFQLQETPDETQIRQFTAQVSNIEFGDKDARMLSATGKAATTMGHKESTHLEKYKSHVMGGSEFIFNRCHSALGWVPPSTSSDPLTPRDLADSLCVLGHESYLPNQEMLCNTVAFPNGKHSAIILTCGGGKSLSWLAPLAAAVNKQKTIGMTLVGHPCKFLSTYHYNDAIAKFGNCCQVIIERLTPADFSAWTSSFLFG